MGRAFIGNFKGPKGDTGPQGAQGIQGIQGPAGPTGAVDGNTPIEFTEAEALANIESGESISTIFGKTKKILGSLLIGAGSTLLGKNLTANQALVSDASGKVNVSGISATELGYLSGVTKNIQTLFNEQNEKLDGLGLSPYAYLYVEPGMTDAQIDEWIRTYFAGGIRRLKIYNGITSYKFGHTGNFNIWMYGDNASEGTGIAIDHWSNQAFLVKTTGPSGDIYVERLVKESESPFLHHAIIEVIPSTTSVIYEYVNPAIKNKSMIIVAFSGTVGSAVVCPYIKSYINMRTKADNQYWGGEVSVNYLSAEGKITFEVLWIGSSQNVSSFKLTDIWY